MSEINQNFNTEQILSNEQNEKLKVELWVDVYKEINQAKDIVNNFIEKFWEDSDKVKLIRSEYNDIREAAINTFIENREITRNDLNKLLQEINEVKEINEFVKYKEDLHSQFDIYKDNFDNWVEQDNSVIEVSLDNFLENKYSISNLSTQEVSNLLTMVYVSWWDYRDKLMYNLMDDTDWLKFLWDNLSEILKSVSIKGVDLLPLTKELISKATKWAINIEIQNFLFKNSPEIGKEKIFELSEKVSEIASSWKSLPEILRSLDKVVSIDDNPSEALTFLANIKALDIVKKESEIVSQEVEDNNDWEVLVEWSIEESNTNSVSEVTQLSSTTFVSKAEKKAEVQKMKDEAILLEKISKAPKLAKTMVDASLSWKDEKEVLSIVKKEAEKQGNTEALAYLDSYSSSLANYESFKSEKTKLAYSNIDWSNVDLKFTDILNSSWVIEIDNWKSKFELTKAETDALMDKDWTINEAKLNSIKYFVKDLSDTGLDFIWEQRDSIIWKIIPDFDIKQWLTERNLSDMKNTLCKILWVNTSIDYDELKNNLVEMHRTNKVPLLFSKNEVLNSMDLAEAKNDTSNWLMSWALHTYMYKIWVITEYWINLDKLSS